MKTKPQNLRIGLGFDAHRFASGRKLVIGGETIDHPMGLAGHSDADVLIHAIIDSLLGAANLGDIGRLFPDSDSRYKDICSIELLKSVGQLLIEKKIEIINIDTVLICEKPKIKDYIDKMKNNISDALNGLPVERIGIKGKTTEKLGFTGREEGIAAEAVALVSITG